MADQLSCTDCKGTGRVAPRPLQRSRKTIQRNVDHAEFDVKVIAAIWPDWQCPLTGLRPDFSNGIVIDPMHILGRGHGEKMFSSPYNHCPGFRGFHASGYRDWPEARALLLKIARRKVDQAIMRGLYNPTLEEMDINAAFLEHAHQMLLQFQYGD